MRTDCTIDRRAVRCPNASHLGHDKYRAQLGDWVIWRESDHHTQIGRMVARVKYAPALGETPVIRNWIEVLALSADLTYAYIRWVDPQWVTRVHAAAPDIGVFLQWFATVPMPSRAACVDMAEYGALRANQSTIPSWDFAETLTRYAEYRKRQT